MNRQRYSPTEYGRFISPKLLSRLLLASVIYVILGSGLEMTTRVVTTESTTQTVRIIRLRAF